jgi:hypothetical protein
MLTVEENIVRSIYIYVCTPIYICTPEYSGVVYIHRYITAELAFRPSVFDSLLDYATVELNSLRPSVFDS